MRKYFIRALIALAILVPLVVVGFLVAMRHAPLTPAQQVALQRLTAPTPPVKGEDASDAMWLLDLDVPEDRRAEVAKQVRRYDYDKSAGRAGKDPAADWPRFLAPPESSESQCDRHKLEGCLAYATEHRAEMAALLDTHRGGVDALRALWRYDGYRNDLPQTARTGLPAFNGRRSLLLSDFALRFVSGEQLTAVDQVCLDLGGWRRIGGDADSLVIAATGVEYVRQDLVLLAEMLHRLPRETDLPSSCADALKPAWPREFDVCPAVRKEFEGVGSLREALEGTHYRFDPRKLDWKRFEARRAEDLARYCDPALLQRMRADRPFENTWRAPPRCDRWEKLADPAGCVFADFARTPDFGGFLDRRVDQAQMLALMRTVLWLRTEVESKEAVAEALKRVPKEFGLLRTPTYDLENDRLSIPLLETHRQERFVLAAGAEPRPTSHRRRMCCSRRPSRNLAMLDEMNTMRIAP